MSEKIRNIVAGIVIANQAELQMSVNGERLHDYESYFNDVFYEHIQENMKHSNWGVWFKQDDETKPHFMVDIFTDSQDDYLLIRRVIEYWNKDNDPQLTIMAPYYTFQQFIEETT
jgi:hypothetical protein